MKISGIYKITSPSNKIYIGQSIDILNREKSYKRGSGYKYQTRLKYSINKYGWETHIFEIIEECEFEKLNIKERYWQDHYDVLGSNGLNCILQETNELPSVISDETRNKMRLSRLGVNNPMFGESHSDETKAKISKALKGKLSGENHPAYGTKHTRNKKGEHAANFGMKHSKESKLKISKSQKGKHISEIGRQNISKSKLGGKNPNSKIVVDLNFGIFYTSIKEASNYYNFTYDYLQRMLRGQYKNKTNLVYC